MECDSNETLIDYIFSILCVGITFILVVNRKNKIIVGQPPFHTIEQFVRLTQCRVGDAQYTNKHNCRNQYGSKQFFHNQCIGIKVVENSSGNKIKRPGVLAG